LPFTFKWSPRVCENDANDIRIFSSFNKILFTFDAYAICTADVMAKIHVQMHSKSATVDSLTVPLQTAAINMH